MNGFLVFFHLVSPIIMGLLIIGLVAIFSNLWAGKLPNVTWRTLIPTGVLLLLAAEIFGMRAMDRLAHPNAQARSFIDWKLLMPHSTWLFFLTWLLIVTFNKQRRNLRMLWDIQPSLHRLKTADISAEGVTISDNKTRLEFSWQAFVGWRETKKLFMLLTSSKSSHFLPKRAFAGDEELNAMRALCELIPKDAGAAFPIEAVLAAPHSSRQPES